jgi:hypothetical protein
MLAVDARWEKKLQCHMRFFKDVAGRLTYQEIKKNEEKMRHFALGCGVGHWNLI